MTSFLLENTLTGVYVISQFALSYNEVDTATDVIVISNHFSYVSFASSLDQLGQCGKIRLINRQH
jgi:hypothetical protein